jgi:uncharacterized membrane protein
LCLGALPFDFVPGWLSPASAYGLFLLTAVVTPSNIYMYARLPVCVLVLACLLGLPGCMRTLATAAVFSARGQALGCVGNTPAALLCSP